MCPHTPVILTQIAKHTPKDKSTKQSLKMKQSLMITDVSDSLSAMKEKKLEEIEAAHHERMSKILEEHQEKIAQIEEDHLPLYYLNKLTDGEKAPKQALLVYFALLVQKMLLLLVKKYKC